MGQGGSSVSKVLRHGDLFGPHYSHKKPAGVTCAGKEELSWDSMMSQPSLLYELQASERPSLKVQVEQPPRNDTGI